MEPRLPDRSIRRVLGPTLLATAIVVRIVPISPRMPWFGTDSSWMVAINRAEAQGLQFGHDIVFPYGPYGAVLTGLYEPGIRTLILVASVVLAAAYVAAARIALAGTGTVLHVAGSLAILLVSPLTTDSLVQLYPAVAVFAIARLPRTGSQAWLVALFALPLGLMPALKISMVPLAAIAVVAGGVLLSRRAGLPTRALFLAVPVLSFCGWWAAAGQHFSGLRDYMHGSLQLVAGYSDAMSLHDQSALPAGATTAIYLVLSAVLIGWSLLSGRRTLDDRVLAGTVACTLFLVFKAGFVRADEHMEMGVLALVAVTGLLAARQGMSFGWQRALVAVVATGSVLGYFATTLVAPDIALARHTLDLAADIARGDVLPGRLHSRYEAALAEIRRQKTLPPAHGTTDFYSSASILLLAQNPHWSPRPVIESYSAYTEDLAELNAKHLLGPDAPETIFYRVAPSDGRLPALEDGASWLPLLQHYDVATEASDFLILRRRSEPRPLSVGHRTETLVGRLGEQVKIPSTRTAWLASFDVRPTLAGKARTILWKPPQLRIEIGTADGRTSVRRFIPGMARADFVLSPYVRNTDGLRALFKAPKMTTPGENVTSITVRLEDPGFPGAGLAWASRYSLRLKSLDIGPDPRSGPLQDASGAPR